MMLFADSLAICIIKRNSEVVIRILQKTTNKLNVCAVGRGIFSSPLAKEKKRKGDNTPMKI